MGCLGASFCRLPRPRALTDTAALLGEPRKAPTSQGSCDTGQAGPFLVEALTWVGEPPPDSGSPGGARSARVVSLLRGRAQCGSLRRFRGKRQRNQGAGTRCQRGGEEAKLPSSSSPVSCSRFSKPLRGVSRRGSFLPTALSTSVPRGCAVSCRQSRGSPDPFLPLGARVHRREASTRDSRARPVKPPSARSSQKPARGWQRCAARHEASKGVLRALVPGVTGALGAVVDSMSSRRIQ
jgi:hypothetical protein